MLSHRALALAALAVAHASTAHAQQPPINGMRPSDPARSALVGATVVVQPGTTLENATILIRNGLIEAVGTDLAVPAGYRVWNVAGKTIFPAFIESALTVDSADAQAAVLRAPGAHWNQFVTPEVSASALVVPDATLDALRAQGFALARVLPEDGIFRGSSDLRLLARVSETVLQRELGGSTVQVMGPRSMDFSAFAGMQTPQTPGVPGAPSPSPSTPAPSAAPRGDRESRSPSSLMGSYALMRQTLLDAAWRRECLAATPSTTLPAEDMNALDALQPLVSGAHGIIVDASDELEVARLIRLVQAQVPKAAITVLASGNEFRAQSELTALAESAQASFIVPMEFPQAPDLISPMAADGISLRDLQTWRYAPTNPKRLLNAGCTVALTTHRLQDKSAFRKRLADAITHGLTKDEALAALTTTPARLLGIDAQTGTIAAGKLANLIIASGDPFDAETKFEGMFVAGAAVIALPDAPVLAAGTFAASTTDATVKPVASDLRIVFDSKDSTFKATWTPAVTAPATEVKPEAEVKPEGEAKTEDVKTEDVKTGETKSDDAKTDDAKPKDGTASAKRASVSDGRASGLFDGEPFGFEGEVRVSLAGGGDRATLTVESVAGTRVSFTLTRVAKEEGKTDDAKNDATKADEAKPDADKPADAKPATTEGGRRGRGGNTEKKPDERETLWKDALPFPLGEYGRTANDANDATTAALTGTVLIKDATIWTLGAQGTLTDGDLLVRDGKIIEVAADITLPDGATLIDGHGMHVTPGLIDCHSHTGISGGVNEGGQACTAEVWIGDCIDPTDIDWYRQLSGGLTAVNQLHGSANPIGGRNSVVKIRWGENAEAFRFASAPPGIKFALGENVVRSKTRYPSSRMGVATFFDDQFMAAREYRARQAAFAALDATARTQALPPRPDLELETLAEILESKRLVHCHSYRQDEILMLLRTAERFGFRVATLQHVLEGYKVAPEIAAHGAGASSFSDWWAYKVEVMDAIPWNGALLHKAGVLVSFNSDSDELARRLNMEAAKAMRYGGLSPIEALKLVTLNPAKQLRVDASTGSLEVGKDADFVLWNGDPLSAFTRCEQTWVDGVRRYSRSEEATMHASAIAQRGALIAKATSGSGDKSADASGAGAGGGMRGGRGRGRPTTLLESMLEAREDSLWLRIARGQDPFAIKSGECGCGVDLLAVPVAATTN